MNSTPSTKSDSSPIPDAICPYCGASEVYFSHEQVDELDNRHRATTCDIHECGQCEWVIQNYQYETKHIANRIGYRGADLGFRERVPEGYVLLVRSVDAGARMMYEIEARVEAEAETTDEHQEAMDSGELEGYTGDFDGLEENTPRKPFTNTY